MNIFYSKKSEDGRKIEIKEGNGLSYLRVIEGAECCSERIIRFMIYEHVLIEGEPATDKILETLTIQDVSDVMEIIVAMMRKINTKR